MSAQEKNVVLFNRATEIIKEARPQFSSIAAQNKRVRWEEESQFAIQAIQKNEKLAECTPYTTINAVINVAAVGLTLNPADGYAYLVPEYNKQTKQNECQLRISFKGLIKNATDSGVISWVRAEIVKEADEFQYRGVNEAPLHHMNPFADRGQSIGVYCTAKTVQGDYLSDVMSWAEVQKIKSCAKTQLVWDAWEDEMAKKAIIKRSAKQWPKSSGSSLFHKTIEIINDTEGNDFIDPVEVLMSHIANEDQGGIVETWEEFSSNEQFKTWKTLTTTQKHKVRNAYVELDERTRTFLDAIDGGDAKTVYEISKDWTMDNFDSHLNRMMSTKQKPVFGSLRADYLKSLSEAEQ